MKKGLSKDSHLSHLLVGSISSIEVDGSAVCNILHFVREDSKWSWDLDGLVICIELFMVYDMYGLLNESLQLSDPINIEFNLNWSLRKFTDNTFDLITDIFDISFSIFKNQNLL